VTTEAWKRLLGSRQVDNLIVLDAVRLVPRDLWHPCADKFVRLVERSFYSGSKVAVSSKRSILSSNNMTQPLRLTANSSYLATEGVHRPRFEFVSSPRVLPQLDQYLFKLGVKLIQRLHRVATIELSPLRHFEEASSGTPGRNETGPLLTGFA
jgi:hypothetical protein